VFGNFVFLVLYSAANERLVEIFALTTDKRFSPQAHNSEVRPKEGHEGTRVGDRYRPGVLNLLCALDPFDKNLVKPTNPFSDKCI
jgi:hypothetical protein